MIVGSKFTCFHKIFDKDFLLKKLVAATLQNYIFT